MAMIRFRMKLSGPLQQPIFLSSAPKWKIYWNNKLYKDLPLATIPLVPARETFTVDGA